MPDARWHAFETAQCKECQNALHVSEEDFPFPTQAYVAQSSLSITCLRAQLCSCDESSCWAIDQGETLLLIITSAAQCMILSSRDNELVSFPSLIPRYPGPAYLHGSNIFSVEISDYRCINGSGQARQIR